MASTKVIKIQSEQSGTFTKSQNIIDFTLPDSTLNLAESYLNLVTTITTTDATPSPDVLTPPGIYNCYFGSSDTLQNVPVGSTPVVYPPKCLIRNSSMSCGAAGDLGGYRNANIRALNLDTVNLSTVERGEDSYLQGLSLGREINGTRCGRTPFKYLQRAGTQTTSVINANLQIPFRDLHPLGDVDSTVPCGALIQPRLHLELENVVETVRTYQAYYSVANGVPCNNTVGTGGKTVLQATTPPIPAYFAVGSAVIITFADNGAVHYAKDVIDAINNVTGAITLTTGITIVTAGTAISMALASQPFGLPCSDLTTGGTRNVINVVNSNAAVSNYCDLQTFPMWVGERVTLRCNDATTNAPKPPQNLLITGLAITAGNAGTAPAITITFSTNITANANTITNCTLTEDAPATATYQISQAQLVLYVPNGSQSDQDIEKKMISKGYSIPFIAYDLEEYNQISTNRFVQTFMLPAQTVASLLFNPFNSYDNKPELYSQLNNTNAYRILLNRVQTTNRDCQVNTSLYYDQLQRAFLGLGLPAIEFSQSDGTDITDTRKLIIAQQVQPVPTETQIEFQIVSTTGTTMPASLLYIYKAVLKQLIFKAGKVVVM